MLLRCEGLSADYHGIPALHGVDFQLAEGECLGIVGPNGAGKTTLLGVLAGIVPLSAGRIEYAGEAIERMPVEARVRRGIVLVPEGRRVFAGLSIEENLLAGAYLRTDRVAVRGDLRRFYRRFPLLHARRREAAGALSGGQQQLLAIGRAVMASPRLLLIDEPTMGLSPAAAREVTDFLRTLSTEGLSMIWAGERGDCRISPGIRFALGKSAAKSCTQSRCRAVPGAICAARSTFLGNADFLVERHPAARVKSECSEEFWSERGALTFR